ncbi:MAG TPA: hypothetical protein VFR25_08540 [Candidatus Eisenbacteria bacterium]|nr:hypothetical protein [Candidatus Eisenbacteria bacterium]
MTLSYNATRLVLTAVLLLILFVDRTADAQYLYLDTTGDGLNFYHEISIGHLDAPADCLFYPGERDVDVYLVTNTNADGTVPTCSTGQSYSVSSYELLFSGLAGVVPTGWTDAMGFDTSTLDGDTDGFVASGMNAWVGRMGAGRVPGTYKLGTLHVVVTGKSFLQIVAQSSSFPTGTTSFASACPGNQLDNTIRLGDDFTAAFPTCYPDPVLPTTWGKVKQHYK